MGLGNRSLPRNDYLSTCWACLIRERRAALRRSRTSDSTCTFWRSQSTASQSKAGGYKGLNGWNTGSVGNQKRSLLSSTPSSRKSISVPRLDALLKETRKLHTSSTLRETRLDTSPSGEIPGPPPTSTLRRLDPNIRKHLALWQDLYGHQNLDELTGCFGNYSRVSEIQNGPSRKAATIDGREDVEEDDDNEVDAISDDIDDLNRQKQIRPGDLVEIVTPGGGESTIAVFIRDFVFQGQYLDSRGAWIHKSMTGNVFSVPGYIDPKLLEPIIPYLPTQELTDEDRALNRNLDLSVPRSVSAKVVAKLQSFQKKSLDEYRKHASILDNAYNLLADETKTQIISLRAIAKKLLNDHNPKPETLCAIRKAVTRSGAGVTYDDRTCRVTGHVYIRPTDELRVVEDVTSWVRQYQEHLASSANPENEDGPSGTSIKTPAGARIMKSFIAKAQKLVAQSRTIRDFTPHGTLGPPKASYSVPNYGTAVDYVSGDIFLTEDRKIIRFLLDWCHNERFSSQRQKHAIGAAIVRAVGCYEGLPFLRSAGYTFLQEIGVLDPFDNRLIYDQNLMLPTTALSRDMFLLHRASRVHTTEATPVDSMKDLRHDWQDMEVYCVDSESAAEIDDGFSLEVIPGVDDEFWVRIHIANPTAYLSPDDNIAKLAEHMTETVYTPERVFPMLPSWLTNGHLSLAPNRPALTFSARINLEGRILETDVRSGWIRNVLALSPQAVSRALGEDMEPQRTLHIGCEIPAFQTKRNMVEDPTPETVKNLEILSKIAEARLKARIRAGGLPYHVRRSEASVYSPITGLSPGLSRPHIKRALFAANDPAIRLNCEKFVSPFSESAAGNLGHKITQEMMLLASEIGARWCHERNIPLLYRATVRNPDRMSPEQFEREVLQKNLDKNGEIPMHLGIIYITLKGNVTCTTTAQSHDVLGLPMYTKVTSPLRRYADMLAHWQIEAALRAESRKEPLRLPFSEQDLKDLTNNLTTRERLIFRIKTDSQHHWIYMFFFRAFYYGEAKLPDTFKLHIFQDGRQIRAMLDDPSVQVGMMDPEPFGLGEWSLGDVWECKLETVNMFERETVFKPIRLISKGSGLKSVRS